MLIESINIKMILLEFYLMRRVFEFLSLYELQCLSFCDENVAKCVQSIDMFQLIEEETWKGNVLFGSENVIGLNMMLKRAARTGRQCLVNIAIAKHANDYNGALVTAAEGGHSDIINQMLRFKAYCINGAMAAAARNGHQHIVDEMLSLGACCYHWARDEAIEGNQLQIVNQMEKLIDKRN